MRVGVAEGLDALASQARDERVGLGVGIVDVPDGVAVRFQPVGVAAHGGAVQQEALLVVARRVLRVVEVERVLDEHGRAAFRKRRVLGEKLMGEDERDRVGHQARSGWVRRA